MENELMKDKLIDTCTFKGLDFFPHLPERGKIINRCFNKLRYGSKILKNAILFDVKVIIEIDGRKILRNFSANCPDSEFQSIEQEIIDSLTELKKDFPILNELYSYVEFKVSNIQYNLNPPKPIFHPMFWIGGDCVGMLDDKMWAAKRISK